MSSINYCDLGVVGYIPRILYIALIKKDRKVSNLKAGINEVNFVEIIFNYKHHIGPRHLKNYMTIEEMIRKMGAADCPFYT